METIIFDVKVNTNNAATDVKKVGDSVKGLKSEGENASKSFTNLRTELKKLNIQLQNLDPASEAFKVAANRAGEIKMAMRDVGDAISDADPEKSFGKFVRGAQAAANGFQIVTAAQGLFGTESKKTQEALLKVQSALALTQGLSQFKEMKNDLLDVASSIRNVVVKAFAGLSTATAAQAVANGTATITQRALNAAMNANPILILVGLITLAAGALFAFSNKTKEADESQKALNDTATKTRANGEIEIKTFNSQIEALKKLKTGSEERAIAIKKINDQYGTTLKNLTDENLFLKQVNITQKDYVDGAKNRILMKINEAKIESLLTESQMKNEKSKYAASKANEILDKNDTLRKQLKGKSELEILNSTFVSEEGLEYQRLLLLSRTSKEEADILNKRADNALNINAKLITKETAQQKIAREKEAADLLNDNAKNLKAQKEAAAKQNEQTQKENDLKKQQATKEQLEFNRKVIDLTHANILDADFREKTILDEKHRRELEDLRNQYDAKFKLTEKYKNLEDQLTIQQGIENKALTDKQTLEKETKDKETNDKKTAALNAMAKAQIENDIRILEKNFQDTQTKKLELEALDFEQKKAAADLILKQKQEDNKLDFEQKKLAILENNAEILAIDSQHAANVEAITEESKNRQIQIDQTLFDAKLEIANSIGNIFGALSGLFEKNIAAQKTFAIAELAVNTATAYMQGFDIAQKSAKATGPAAAFTFPLFYASQVGAILSAVGKAKSILKAGPSVSAPTIPSATKGGGGVNNAISDNNQGEQTSQNVIKVVVLDSDITKQQQQTTKVKAVSTIIG